MNNFQKDYQSIWRRGSRHNIDRQEYTLRASEFQPRGEELPQAKLSDEDVLAIRSSQKQRENLRRHIETNLSNKALAKTYGISERAIERILARETWVHL